MKNKFDLAIYNRLKSGKHIALELKSTSEHLRRWIAIYKPDGEPINKNIPKRIYSIVEFELNVNKMEEYFGDEDMLNQKRFYANSEEELISILNSLNIDIGKFTYPWKCDYPL